MSDVSNVHEVGIINLQNNQEYSREQQQNMLAPIQI